MKFTVILATVLASMADQKQFASAKSNNKAESKYTSNLLRSAKETSNSQLRNLEGEDGGEVDLSNYAVKFQKCQFVKSYDDELAADEETETVLATKRFIVFRLCPDNTCSSCSSNYGEYLVDLETYLQATIDYQQDLQQGMCDACQNVCGDYNNGNYQYDDDGGNNNQNERKLANYYDVDCDSCYEECLKIENMEENGYVDATDFMECQMIYDPEDDDKQALYAGPMCASSGSKIKIGVFTDENCNVVDSTKDVDDYMYQMKLSHALLKTVYADGACVSCGGGDYDDDGGDANDMCQQLYEESAKCEQAHGFELGYQYYNGYDNQYSQEEIVCDFIDSIKAGSYDDYGEIVVNGASASPSSTTTSGQKFALAFFICGTMGLAFYAATLHRQLTKGVYTQGLVSQGGDLA